MGAWKDKREQIREWVMRRGGQSAGTDGCGAVRGGKQPYPGGLQGFFLFGGILVP